VLGGLIAEQEDEEESGIPFLSRIPVLGYAFKNTKVKVSRKELIIFIQPIVVEDDLALAEASANEAARSQLGSAPATFDIPQPDPNEEPGPDAQPQRKLPRLRHP
jgi:general secretion pathway protein D